MEEFDEKLFVKMVDRLKIKAQNELIFILTNGLELTEYL